MGTRGSAPRGAGGGVELGPPRGHLEGEEVLLTDERRLVSDGAPPAGDAAKAAETPTRESAHSTDVAGAAAGGEDRPRCGQKSCRGEMPPDGAATVPPPAASSQQHPPP